MTLTQAILGFTAVVAVLTVIPGIDTTLVLRSTLIHGRRTAAATATGICLGLFVWGAAAAVGAAALLAASAVAFRVVTYAGAAYLIWLGARMLIGSLRGTGARKDADPAPPRLSPGRALVTGLTTNVLNPKIGVFYIATIPQFIPPDAPPLATGLLLAAVHAVLTVAWFALIILGGSFARRWLANARALRWVDGTAGGFLVAMGARLALAHR